jgi:predicted RNase H-like HicB family nuclease
MNGMRYTAIAERSGRWWALQVPAVPGVFTQARTLKEARGMVRSAVSLALECPPDSFDVDLEVRVSAEGAIPNAESVTALLKDVAEKDLAADRAAAVASEATRRAATTLRDAGLTLSDTGELLGVSYQRVQQLITESRRSREDGTAGRRATRQKVCR